MVISQILPDLAQICLPTPKSRLVASCGPFRLLHTTLVQICPQRNPNTATTTFFGGDYDHCLQGQGQIPHYGHKFLCLDELEVGLTGLKHWRVQCILYDSIIKMYVYLFMQCVHILNAYVYIYHILHILYIYACSFINKWLVEPDFPWSYFTRDGPWHAVRRKWSWNSSLLGARVSFWEPTERALEGMDGLWLVVGDDGLSWRQRESVQGWLVLFFIFGNTLRICAKLLGRNFESATANIFQISSINCVSWQNYARWNLYIWQRHCQRGTDPTWRLLGRHWLGLVV